MSRPDILIFIEHVARELDLACLIKLLAKERYGLQVDIRSICYDLEETLQQDQPTVVCTPYCYSGRDYGLFDIVHNWPEARYVNLAFEQIFLRIQHPFKAQRDRFSHEMVTHLAWGESGAEFFRQNGVCKDNIRVTGCAVHALYQKPYSQYFEGREQLAKQYGLDPDRPWLLIPEQYGVAVHNNAHLYAKGGISIRQAEEFQEVIDASFSEAIQWWFAAARQNEAEVIVRPRPAVPKETLRQRMTEVGGVFPSRLHVIKDGSVREWIMSAQAVASSYSTTLIEAAVACRESCMMMPVPFPEICRSDWFDAAHVASDLDFFLQSVSSDEAGTWQGLNQWAKDNLGLDAQPVNNLVDALFEVVEGRLGPGSPAENSFSVDVPTKFFTAPLKAHEQDEITETMVANRVRRWKSILG